MPLYILVDWQLYHCYIVNEVKFSLPYPCAYLYKMLKRGLVVHKVKCLLSFCVHIVQDVQQKPDSLLKTGSFLNFCSKSELNT